MRVIHYIDNLDGRLGGTVRAVQNMVDCQRRNLDVKLVVRGTLEQRRAGADETGSGEPKSRSLPGRLLSPMTLRRFNRALDNADVLHLHSVWSPVNAQLAIAAGRRRVAVCLSPHGALDPWPMSQKRLKKCAYLRVARRLFLQQLAAIHATCDMEARSVRALLPHADVHVVHLPLDQTCYAMAARGLQAASEQYSAATLPLSLVFVGRLHPKKRVDRVVETLAVLLSRGYDAELTIIGSGSKHHMSQITGLVRALGVQHKVHAIGFIPQSQRRRLLSMLSACDIAIVPSEHENFGFVCFEALAAGVPLVTTAGVMMSEQLLDSGAALVSDGNPEDLADRIISIAGRDERVEMGRSGRQWLLRELDRNILAERFARMYTDLSMHLVPAVCGQG